MLEIITFLTSLAIACVAGWFSIAGLMAVFAGAAMPALVMGAVLEVGKLVTASWVYNNWEYATWQLKVPLVTFTIILMFITSMGIFGFLSKAHLEQGASTVDNADKIARLDQQIAREKSTIDDDEKVIGQLDGAIASYLGKDRADKSVSVRKSQEPQRKQLRDDMKAAQARIDDFSNQKQQLQSEVRKVQLEVGPVRYIAELIYGSADEGNKNLESAVRLVILIIVSTFDPLAVILLIAANSSLERIRREKKKAREKIEEQLVEEDKGAIVVPPEVAIKDYVEPVSEPMPVFDPVSFEEPEKIQESDVMPEGHIDRLIEEIKSMPKMEEPQVDFDIPVFEEPAVKEELPVVTPVEDIVEVPEVKEVPHVNEAIMREIFGFTPHFVPAGINELPAAPIVNIERKIEEPVTSSSIKTRSWLNEFRKV